MIAIPEHIKILVNKGCLEEKMDYHGRRFDREEIRIFSLTSSDNLCTLTLLGDHITVHWTDYALDMITFLQAFESMSEKAKETIIFNMDKFHEEI